jgi:hypothetical protein
MEAGELIRVKVKPVSTEGYSEEEFYAKLGPMDA